MNWIRRMPSAFVALPQQLLWMTARCQQNQHSAGSVPRPRTLICGVILLARKLCGCIYIKCLLHYYEYYKLVYTDV